MNSMRVNGGRLWSRLMQMAEIGATPHGGCNRQALTDADVAGRKLLSRWAEAAGCRVRVDAVGNLFARRPGREDALPVVMTGSHLDTQPTGGKFDGVYGVLAGLEVIETLNERAGVPTDAPLSRQAVKASFEVHIEQGPVLEQKAKTIGVVTGVQHMSRHEVVVAGQEAHAGPTPMDMVRSATAALGFNFLEMISGAGHDSCNVSAVAPTAMVFVPCAGGLSHNEAESALPIDLEAGANVLLPAMLSMATTAAPATQT